MGEEASALKKKSRIWEIDFLRGFIILLMIMDHTFYDFTLLVRIQNALFSNARYFWLIEAWADAGDFYWNHPVRVVVHYCVTALFFILSGISCTLSKNNWWHAGKILIASVLFQGVTWIIYAVGVNLGAFSSDAPGEMVAIFNVLLAMGIGVLVTALLRKIKMKHHAAFMLILGGVIFAVSISLQLYSLNQLYTPWYGYKWFYDWISWEDILPLLVGTKCWGSDYFAIIPYLAYSFIGCGIGEIFYEKKKQSLLPKLDGKWNKPVCFVGRHTIWVYLAHQPVILAILILICLCVGYRF